METAYIQRDTSYYSWKPDAEKEVEQWFLMRNTSDVFIVLILYFLITLVIGPALMKNRKPLELKKTIIVYNGAQVILSVFLLYKAFEAGIPFNDYISSTCHHKINKTPGDQLLVSGALWWYLMAKISEMLDTVFFVLRKKHNQVSILHVYHHFSTFFLTWCILKFSAEEQSVFLIAINSFIHVIMYLYYMIAAMGPEYQKYLWWKKYMTRMQIVQFIMCMAYLLMAKYSNCGYSDRMTNVLISNCVVLLVLFSHFYIKSYKKKIT